MNLVKKVLQKFNGLHYRQEYLCFAKESFEQGLNVYLVSNQQVIKDITNQHLFVGYCPLVFAFTNLLLPENITLIFSNRVIPLNEQFVKKDAIAVLHLKRIQQQTTGSSNILYYEGMKGEHFFQSEWRQFIIDINNNRYNKKPGNVFLHSNLYRQVQIAYAIPRIIALVTISDGETCNLFPTDLHGQADNEHYIISLRTGGKALEQVEAAGKVVITELDYTAYKMVYALGKNHMQPLKPRSDFPFSTFLSNSFKWPIPQQAIACKEMLLVDSFTHGIHKILLFKIIADQQFTPQAATLAHIHNSYASWRYKNKLTGNYLLR